MDRKRKLELDEDNNSKSDTENSPSKRKRHSLDFKLKVMRVIKPRTVIFAKLNF